MAFAAKYPGSRCERCKQEILVGEWINLFNRPHPKSKFHVTQIVNGEKVCLRSTTNYSGTDSGTDSKTDSGTDKSGTDSTDSADSADSADSKSNSTDSKGDGASKPPPTTLEEIVRDIAGQEIDARLDSYKPDASLDREEIERIAQAASTRTVRVEIVRQNAPEHRIENAHPFFGRLLSVMNAGLFPYLWGPAGTGKSTALIMAADALGLSHELETLDRTTSRTVLVGYRTPNGEPVATGFSRAFTDGGFYIHDELDLCPGEVQTLLNSALANGAYNFAWGLIKRSEAFRYAGAGNTPGFGPTPDYRDREPMSQAFRDRLYHLFWPADPNVERRACGRPLVAYPTRDLLTCSAEEWGEWIDAIRAYAAREAPLLKRHLGTRAVLSGLKALAAGETPEEVADGLVFRGADDTLRSKALRSCPLPSHPVEA